MGLIKKNDVSYGGGGGGDTTFEIDDASNSAALVDNGTGSAMSIDASDATSPSLILSKSGTYYKELNLATKGDVNNKVVWNGANPNAGNASMSSFINLGNLADNSLFQISSWRGIKDAAEEGDVDINFWVNRKEIANPSMGEVALYQYDAEIQSMKGIFGGQIQGKWQTSGNWMYRITGNYFEGIYTALNQSIAITNPSGAFYRSDKQTLTVPAAIRDDKTLTVKHASINCGHSGYPNLGALETIIDNGITWYALSGSTLNQTGGYFITAEIKGVLS